MGHYVRMDGSLTGAGAAFIGAVVGGNVVSPVIDWLAPRRQAQLAKDSWLRQERRVLYVDLARVAKEAMTYAEDFVKRAEDTLRDSSGQPYFDEGREVYMRSPGDLVKISAELHVIGTADVIDAWTRYCAAAEEVRIAFVWASEDEGAAAYRAMPTVITAAGALLEQLATFLRR